jgi:acyl-CoA reductase-like NAD-dependent aldehyde dehydrogenase
MSAPSNLCGGRRLPSAATAPVVDPATLQVVDRAPVTSAQQLVLTVDAAQAALAGPWSRDLAMRQRALATCADRLEAEQDRLAVLLSREQGKPLASARIELAGALRLLRHFAARPDPPQVLRDNAQGRVDLRRSPIGVVALIVPWNYPILILMMKLAPALWAGNTVVVKPAPSTPLTTLALAALLDGGLPPGVVNTVTGEGDVGAALVAHPLVRKVSFTGSTPTGVRVMDAAAAGLKRLTLELGGNDAALVLDDVDVASQVPRLFASAFTNAGQLCCAIKRLYVHRRLHDAVAEGLADLAAGWRVGPGLHPDTQMGPLHNRAQRDHVLALLHDADARGGRRLTGGEALADWPGHFLRPAIVTGLADDARLVAEEQFGPALAVLPFDDEDEALARANASPFGLGGSVWSGDPDRAAALAERLDAVNLYVNQHAVPPDPELPFGGTKASGFGYELGDWGCDDFSVRRVLHRPAVAA